MRIAELPREQFEGYELVFSYDSKAYYDLRLRTGNNVFACEFVRTPCAPVHKEFADKLFAPHWDDPHAYGLWDGNDLRAVIEVTPKRGTTACGSPTCACRKGTAAGVLARCS